jgi:hypothetical protein
MKTITVTGLVPGDRILVDTEVVLDTANSGDLKALAIWRQSRLNLWAFNEFNDAPLDEERNQCEKALRVESEKAVKKLGVVFLDVPEMRALGEKLWKEWQAENNDKKDPT